MQSNSRSSSGEAAFGSQVLTVQSVMTHSVIPMSLLPGIAVCRVFTVFTSTRTMGNPDDLGIQNSGVKGLVM